MIRFLKQTTVCDYGYRSNVERRSYPEAFYKKDCGYADALLQNFYRNENLVRA